MTKTKEEEFIEVCDSPSETLEEEVMKNITRLISQAAAATGLNFALILAHDTQFVCSTGICCQAHVEIMAKALTDLSEDILSRRETRDLSRPKDFETRGEC